MGRKQESRTLKPSIEDTNWELLEEDFYDEMTHYGLREIPEIVNEAFEFFRERFEK